MSSLSLWPSGGLDESLQAAAHSSFSPLVHSSPSHGNSPAELQTTAPRPSSCHVPGCLLLCGTLSIAVLTVALTVFALIVSAHAAVIAQSLSHRPAVRAGDGAGRLSAAVGLVNVLEYGAIGDGASHPAHTKFSSLAELRAAYPFATSLDNELDWLGTQAAILFAASPLRGGGTVYSPAGHYVCDQTLVLPSSSDYYSGNDSTTSVNWRGDGAMNTVYHWPVDAGRGAYAVLATTDRPSGTSGGFMEDLRLSGPSLYGPMGSAPVAMSGLGWAARRSLSRLGIDGFYIGIDMVGDQTRFADLVISGCYYGMYWDNPSHILFGDFLFERLIVTNHFMAAIGVHPNTTLGEMTFISCILGVAPFAIFKETGGSLNEVVHGCVFLNCQFENIGLAMIGEDTMLTGQPRRSAVYLTKFIMPEFAWNSDYAIPNIFPIAIIDVAEAYLMEIDGIREPGLWHPPAVTSGTSYVLSIDFITQSSISGDLRSLIDNPAQGQAFLHSYSPQGLDIRLLGADGWRGQALLQADATGLSLGTVVAFAPNLSYLAVQAASGGLEETIAGVLVHDPYDPQSPVIVASAGQVMVRTAGPLHTSLVRAGPAGLAYDAVHGYGDVKNRIIGMATGQQQGNSTQIILKL